MEDTQQVAAEQSQENSAASVTDLLSEKLFGSDEQPTNDAPEEDNAEVEGADAEVQADPQEDNGPQLKQVEFDGKTYELPPEVSDALMRQQDYTRKTQEVAQQRQQLETQQRQFQEAVKFQTDHAQDLQQLNQLASQIAQYDQVNWAEAFANDPAAAGAAQATLNQLERQRNALHGKLTQAQQTFQAQQQAQHRQLLEAGQQELSRSIPGWSQEKAKAINEFGANTYGFTAQELGGITDPRMVKVLHDAYQFQQLKAAKPAVEKRVQALPKPIRPGGNENRVTDHEIQTKKAMSTLKQTGSPSAAREALMLRLKG